MTSVLAGVDPLVYAFVILFAVSSWVDINGVWVELPLLVRELPEGWSLPSHLALIIQAANAGPALYLLAHWRLGASRMRRADAPLVYVIVGAGAASCVLLSATWWRTVPVGGGTRVSLWLLIESAVLALVDCTSSVVYLPYMARLPPVYMTALYVGEGLSGVVPGLAGLIQGAGGEPVCVNVTAANWSDSTAAPTRLVPRYPPPLFSVSGFFLLLLALLCVSLGAFTLLHFLPRSRRLHNRTSAAESDSTTSGSSAEYQNRPNTKVTLLNDHPPDNNQIQDPDTSTKQPTNADSGEKLLPVSNNSDVTAAEVAPPMHQVLVLLTLVVWTNALTNGILTSTSSYSALPYGQQAYALAVRLSSLSSPLASLTALFLPCKRAYVLALMTVVGTVLAAYEIALAVLSPTPPLQHQTIGAVLMVTSSVTMSALFSFVKVSAASLLRVGGRRPLLWCGALTQLGSLLGAIVAYLLVNTFRLFHSAPACA